MDDSSLKCQFPLPYYTLTLACLGITDQFLHSPYILRIEMGGGRGSGSKGLTMIRYSELVSSIINEGVKGARKCITNQFNLMYYDLTKQLKLTDIV